MNKDEIVIAAAMNGQIRIHAARTTQLVEAARIAHNCMPTSAAALGRTLTVTAIMASDLKNSDEKIVAMINGHGPSGTILAQANGNGDVRGFIGDPSLYFAREDGHLDVARAVGTDGNLTVTRDMGLRKTFSGVSALQTGEIGDDFAYYFAISEQTPSIVGVGVLVDTDLHIKAAGGLICQLMPNASEEAIQKAEQAAAVMRPVSSLIDEGLDLPDVIRLYFPDAEMLDTRDVRWHCGCSREHFFNSLATLKESDLEEMIADGSGAEIRCQYCNSLYHYDTEDLKQILEMRRVVNR